MAEPEFELGAPHPKKMDELRLAAYHESGHMAIAEGCGIRVKYVEINKAFLGGVSGVTWLDFRNTPGLRMNPDGSIDAPEEFIRANMLCCLAGWRTVHRWYLETWQSPGPIAEVSADSGCCTDLRHFREYSRMFPMSLPRGIQETDSLVNLYWPRITACAKALYARQKLDRARIEATAAA
jgi:hypothetical protein